MSRPARRRHARCDPQERLDELAEDDLADTACAALSTVPTSSRSTGVPMVAVGDAETGRREIRMKLFELPHLTVSSPTQIAVTGVTANTHGDLLEATGRVEAEASSSATLCE